MHYTKDFKFQYILPEVVARCRTEAEHLSLQIQDAYLRLIDYTWQKEHPNKPPIDPWDHLGPDGFAGYSDEDILEKLRQNKVTQKAKRAARRADARAANAHARAQKHAARWKRPDSFADRYEVVDGRLHEVRESRSPTGQVFREVSPFPINSSTIYFDGERISTSLVVNILTGTRPKRGRKPKGERYRAQVREGSKVIHIGVYGTAYERDAAVLTYRLGLTP